MFDKVPPALKDQAFVCFLITWYGNADWLTRADGWIPNYIPKGIVLDIKRYVGISFGPGWRRTIEEALKLEEVRRIELSDLVATEMQQTIRPKEAPKPEHSGLQPLEPVRSITIED